MCFKLHSHFHNLRHPHGTLTLIMYPGRWNAVWHFHFRHPPCSSLCSAAVSHLARNHFPGFVAAIICCRVSTQTHNTNAWMLLWYICSVIVTYMLKFNTDCQNRAVEWALTEDDRKCWRSGGHPLKCVMCMNKSKASVCKNIKSMIFKACLDAE